MPRTSRLAFDSEQLERWDTGLLTFLANLGKLAEQRQLQIDDSGLPEGARRLLGLASAVPEQTEARRDGAKVRGVARLGTATTGLASTGLALVRFAGLTFLSFLRFLRGKASFRGVDLWLFVQEAGASALGITALISFLIGIIVAFIGVAQLRQFDALLWTANIVAIGMVRYLGPMMTAIIMAGRTGAAYAAQIGTMTVNEEVDALSTLGVSPIDFLVLPRMLALIVMMPLLTLYADFVGILGGATIGVFAFGLGAREYFTQTQNILSLTDVLAGLNLAATYAVIVAASGCFRGLHSGRSAAAVGRATTSAVVMAIVLIVVATAFWTITYDILGV